MNPFDLYIYNFISKLYNIPFTMFMRKIIKNKKMFLYFCFLTLTSDISSNIIKNIIKRPRPSEIIKISFNSGYSFPSTHVVISTCLYGFIKYLLRKNIKNKKLKNIL